MPGGKQILLSQYRGKAVVLAFILTYCSHCQRTMGFLIKDQNEFGSKGLQVLSSAIEDGAARALPNFIRTFNPPFPVGYNADQGAVLDYLQHPRMVIPHMPLLVFIDRQGVIRAQFEGDSSFFDEAAHEQNLRNQIQVLLQGVKKVAPKKKTN